MSVTKVRLMGGAADLANKIVSRNLLLADRLRVEPRSIRMRGNRHYVHLAIMTALSFISMYILMYAMVNRFANVYSNLNQFYMAGLMTAPIVVIELALMRSVYDNKNANIVIIAVSVVALGAFFLGIRQQAAIGDKSFLTSMIPHHAGAILMCERAPIQDAEIKKLCGEIISSQQREIDQMKSMLARLIQVFHCSSPAGLPELLMP